ncbi:MAG: sulfatase [Planctomycetaceae bacterium]|nr:sulfatase [Planctomycetaceae bacterium]
MLFSSVLHAAERPNFVWLVSEDNSKHYLKLFDEHGAETPRIAEMAEQGLLFEHAFSNAPVCSVARTTLITGCYAPRIGTQFHRKMVEVPLPGDLRMFPAYLREAGYYTTNRQKKDYNAIEGDKVWDESSKRASWRDRRDGQPFFHYQSFPVTHESSLHFSAEEMANEATETDPDEVTLAPYHPDTPTFRYTHARYHDRIRELDGQIGEVLDQLQTDGLLEDTFVFYFGDHGGVLPRSKGYVYESGLHVPLVVRVPKNWQHLAPALRGTRIDGFVSFIDFGPTLLHLAGLPVPDEVDGRPFLGEDVTLADLNARNEAFGHADRFDEKYDLVRSLRRGKFKYIRSYQPFNFDGLQNNYRYRMLAYAEWRRLSQEGQLNDVRRQFFETRPPEALYDLEADPHETVNLAIDPKHAETLTQMREALSNKLKTLPDLSLYPESHLVEHAFDNPTKFGAAHQQDIARLVDTADLSLHPFDEVRDQIEAALQSENPWERYWALITCSTHGKSAKVMIPQATSLATSDPERLVRIRAAEFLAFIEAGEPGPVLTDALCTTESATEANLILNTVVLLRDRPTTCQFEINENIFQPSVRKAEYVQRRLSYLNE